MTLECRVSKRRAVVAAAGEGGRTMWDLRCDEGARGRRIGRRDGGEGMCEGRGDGGESTSGEDDTSSWHAHRRHVVESAQFRDCSDQVIPLQYMGLAKYHRGKLLMTLFKNIQRGLTDHFKSESCTVHQEIGQILVRRGARD